ncbi:hypothetical protein [Curvivirga aplysinae]|uniref:hypothetical protein n=1 Tax=Curvivirga aplysinae TaxID=2529852 RepID=UPI001C3FCB68|nr:hypothetical protein [Curvivirga aplysinae]MTI09483.1 hypothetical protein [Curvivirga aplysinae]
MPDLSRFQKAWLICLIGSLICVGLMAARSKMAHPDRNDSMQYISAAHNLSAYGIYSQSLAGKKENINPGIGREPGFPFVMAQIYSLGLGDIEQATMTCLRSQEGCGVQPYKAVQWLNRIFFALAGIAVFWLSLSFFSSLKLATIAGSSVWLNIKMQSSMDQIISDPLALVLVCGFTLLAAKTLVTKSHKKKILLAVTTGFSLSFLILTKAIFMYFFYLSCIILIGYLIALKIDKVQIKKFTLPALVFVITSALLPALWINRNGEISGHYKLTDMREGIALSARNIFHDMTLPEYFTSFVYWIPGSGDSFARRFIPEEHWIRFDLSNPDGFFRKGHGDFSTNVQRLIEEDNVSPEEARQKWTDELKRQILSNPVTHALTTIPLFYRGILRDIFIPLSLPGMIFLIFWAFRNRQMILLAVLSPAFFSLVFYPLVSLNVSRYQITAAPAFAMGLVFFFVMIHEWKKKRKEKRIPA